MVSNTVMMLTLGGSRRLGEGWSQTSPSVSKFKVARPAVTALGTCDIGSHLGRMILWGENTK